MKLLPALAALLVSAPITASAANLIVQPVAPGTAPTGAVATFEKLEIWRYRSGLNVNVGALYDAAAPGATNRTVTLNLFDDASFTAEFVALDAARPDIDVWAGNITSGTLHGGTAIFAIDAAGVTGTIRLDEKLYLLDLTRMVHTRWCR